MYESVPRKNRPAHLGHSSRQKMQNHNFQQVKQASAGLAAASTAGCAHRLAERPTRTQGPTHMSQAHTLTSASTLPCTTLASCPSPTIESMMCEASGVQRLHHSPVQARNEPARNTGCGYRCVLPDQHCGGAKHAASVEVLQSAREWRVTP